MGQLDNGRTGLSLTKFHIGTLVLAILNFSSDILLEVNLVERLEVNIYGIVAGGLLIATYSIRFFKNENKRLVDYLKFISVLLIAHYPFIYLYATEPWDNSARIFSLYVPATVYINDIFILRPRTTTKPIMILTFVQAVVIGFLLLYSQLMIKAAQEVQMGRVADREEMMIEKAKADKIIEQTMDQVDELKKELENCR